METLLDIGMAIGPVLGYVHQYHVISSTKSTGTFSIDICGILLFANILRLNFYVFNKFAIALLWQSIVMILAQIVLVHVCTKYKSNKNLELVGEVPGGLKKEMLEKFWRWDDFSTYFLFIAVFTFVSFAITLTFKQYDIQNYGVFVGLTALLSESILILPQILKNYHKKSTKGLSYLLVGLNLLGDIFKFIYFIIKAQAFQFIICGAIQIVLDSYVIFQIYFYRGDRFAVDKDSVDSIEEMEKYEVRDQIKPETEKDIGEQEMVEVPIYNSETANQLLTSQEKTMSENKKIVDKSSELKLPLNLQKQKRIASKNTEKETQSKKVEKPQSMIENSNEKDLSQTQQETNSQTTDSRLHKALSSQNIPSINSVEFFEADYVVPARSIQNVKVES